MVRSGAVALLWFPFGVSQPQPFKKRPVLILNRSGSGPEQCVACVMITGSAERLANPTPTDVLLDDWQGLGLAKESLVRTNRFWSAEASHVERVLGQAPPDLTAEIRKFVGVALGIRDEPYAPAENPTTSQ